jgi:hypothetical protein
MKKTKLKATVGCPTLGAFRWGPRGESNTMEQSHRPSGVDWIEGLYTRVQDQEEAK